MSETKIKSELFPQMRAVYENLELKYKSEIRNAKKPEDISPRVVNIVLTRSGHKASARSYPRFQRVIFFLPYAAHNKKVSIGLCFSKVNEKHFNKLYRCCLMPTEKDNSLNHIKRIFSLAKSSGKKEGANLYLNWENFGWILFLWGKEKKQELCFEYFSNKA